MSKFSIFCCLKCPFSSFSSPFLFSGYFCSFDACVICIFSGGCNQSPSTLFFLCSLLVIVSMHERYLECCKSSSSFLDTFSWLTSSLECKALCIVMSFLVLRFICWSSSLVHVMNGSEYLTRGTAHVFILLLIFLPFSLVSISFLHLLRYSFFFFLSSTHV